MKCIICKQGVALQGYTTVTLERKNLTLVVKEVPALVCDNCGEAYLDEKAVDDLLTKAEEATQAGVQVDVRHFVAA
ncbi:MAG: type II toxin-antitoxin system MqsA family antitoxin [Magnetococcales bacterium]|nr:type II toxin-antitoxin system MqsA family antitoxin [Magnetococcales bacterium]